MATIITSECINCGACEPECPNTAIYAGGVPWEFNGESHDALSQDIFYIVPSKCTECVGFYDHEACAAVCPVDCCIPDPNSLESEAVLLERARVLHPELTIADDAPSRFRKGEGGAVAAPEGAAAVAAGASAAKPQGAAPASETGASAARPASAGKPAPVAAPSTPAPSPAATVAAPSLGGVGTPTAAPVAMMNLPRDVGALPGPIAEKHFPGEIPEDFETVLASVDLTEVEEAPLPVKLALRLGEPLLGALPDRVKAELEEQAGGPGGFSRIRATALNMVLNALIYPAVLLAFGVVVMGDPLFSQATSGWIMLGILIASVEALWRLREGTLSRRPASEITYRASSYGLLLAPLGVALARGGRLRHETRKVAFDGFTIDLHDEKTERDRRYGTVYTTSEHANAYLVRLEMPRKVPQSSLKRLWDLPDDMPDYDYNISLDDGVLTISASVRGEALRKLCSVSPSFPADFLSRIEFDKPVSAFKHRLRNKVLEIIVLKNGAAELLAAA